MTSCASGNTTPSASGACTKHHRRSAAAAAFFGQARDGGVLLEFAQAVGHFVFVAEVREAFEFARAGRGDHHVLARASRPRTSAMKAGTLP